MVFNATFNNITVISWRSILLVEKTGETTATGHWQSLSHNVVSNTHVYEKNVCTAVLYELMNLLRNYVNNMFIMCMYEIEIYWEFYHSIICIANEGRHVRINNIL